MIYRKVKEVVADYPAFDVVQLTENGEGYIELQDGDRIVFKSGIKKYMIGSVASYAIKNNRCPIKDHVEAVKAGFSTHYIFGTGACLTAHKREKGRLIRVDDETLYKFEGRIFKIGPAPNDNLKFIPQDED